MSGVESVVPEWESTSTHELLQRLVDVAGAVPGIIAANGGLSTSELHALRHLVYGPVGPVDLARALGVTSAASSGIVDRLVARGHVERSPHPSDRRRTAVVITDSGRAEVLSLLQPMFARLARLDADLDDADRAAVNRYLSGAIEAMNALR